MSTKRRPRRQRRARLEPQDREILNAQGVAAALGISERLVLRLAREGKLPCQKIGREWRFSRSAIRGYLSGGTGDDLEAALTKRGVSFTVKKR